MRKGEEHPRQPGRHARLPSWSLPIAGAALLAAAIGGLGSPAPALGQTAPLAFGTCQKSQVTTSVPGLQCATLQVPLDRANPSAGTVALAVQRVPASGPRVGVIVLLAGGPGQAAIPPFESEIAPLSRPAVLRGFELVAFDQRGTGQSGELRCEPSLAASAKEDFTEACGNSLGPSRADYTSQASVEDLDAVREALGGGPLSLLAVSYGGRVAGMYAHEHPGDVARMVLDSPSPIAGDDPLRTQSLRALPRVLNEGICGAGACRSFTTNAYADLARLAARLRGGPLHTRIYDGHGRLSRTTITERDLLRLADRLDLPGGLRMLAPAAISAAADGDAAPLARLTQEPRSTELGGVSVGLFLATYCDENPLPWPTSSDPASRRTIMKSFLASVPPSSVAPFALDTVARSSPLSLCASWPATPPAPAAPGGISATPTLILSGADDLRTPFEQSLAIAVGYSHVQLLRIPATGHSTVSTDLSGCARTAMIGFLTSGQAPSACPLHTEPTALPLPPASLAQVRPARSASRLAGRVGAAVAITLEDIAGQPGSSGGGLRGGSWVVRQDARAETLVLSGAVDVPGVRVSGTITATHSSVRGRLTINGRLRGTLRLAGQTLSGRIGGAAVRARLVRP